VDSNRRIKIVGMVKNLKRPWTEQENRLLRKLAEANASTTLIAAKLKRRTTAVRAHASILKIPLRRPKLSS